jgi:2-polyprenyl-3-methyl-5-hydroxy-6-metoxy-1,4-benzoquinol methylase
MTTIHCPGCDGATFSKALFLPDQPVVLNHRFDSAPEAMGVPRRDITLIQCLKCGLAFNSTFEADVVSYDARYENSQCFSGEFRKHVTKLAGEITDRYNLIGGRILEVGCGKGDFLRLICRVAQATGEGYDTTYSGPPSAEHGRIRFFREHVDAEHIAQAFDAIICRHVIEHVPNIGSFLRQLWRLANAAKEPVVVLETPRFEWIVEQKSFWDVFYEHCNYFNQDTLAYLCRNAGFEVLRHEIAFQGQYQAVELRAEVSGPMKNTAPGIPANGSLEGLAAAMSGVAGLESRLRDAGAATGWAIWGAGAKGVALANQLTLKPRFLIDANPGKQGGFVPGTGIPVISPNDSRVLDVPLILVPNPNYLSEIRASLQSRGFRHTLFSI